MRGLLGLLLEIEAEGTRLKTDHLQGSTDKHTSRQGGLGRLVHIYGRKCHSIAVVKKRRTVGRAIVGLEDGRWIISDSLGAKPRIYIIACKDLKIILLWIFSVRSCDWRGNGIG